MNDLILPDDIFVPGVPKPESDYEEMDRLGRKLGIPVPQLFLTVSATNPDGSQGDRYAERARTFNRNFWNLMFGGIVNSPTSAVAYSAGNLGVKWAGGYPGNTVKSMNYSYPDSATAYSTGAAPFSFFPAAAGNTSRGILVGTGNTAESFEGSTLIAMCAEGTGVNQMNYLAQQATTASYNAGAKVWASSSTRVMNNNSNSTVVIAEAGLMMYDPIPQVGFGESWPMLFERSLLGATVSVLSGGQLTVTYSMQITFPA